MAKQKLKTINQSIITLINDQDYKKIKKQTANQVVRLLLKSISDSTNELYRYPDYNLNTRGYRTKASNQFAHALRKSLLAKILEELK
tara:strand:- start:603 stop:863 length:261 start_codon:yes stop_codon:yes gene_type:complete